jgi:hypothetical protein
VPCHPLICDRELADELAYDQLLSVSFDLFEVFESNLVGFAPPFEKTRPVEIFDDFTTPFGYLRGPVGGVAPNLLAGECELGCWGVDVVDDECAKLAELEPTNALGPRGGALPDIFVPFAGERKREKGVNEN